MALSTATVDIDLTDLLGNVFITKSTKIWVDTNIDGDTVVDTEGDEIRLGAGKVSLNGDGTAQAVVWVPGVGSNPSTWQTTIHINYQDSGTHTRKQRDFGPFTIVSDANLADLVTEQEVPPEYLTRVTTNLQGYLDEGAALLAAQEALATITTTDEELTYIGQHGTTFAPFVAGLAQDAADVQFANLVGNVGTFVEHGADADFPRPSIPGPVVWSGTVHPNNVAGGDYIFIRSTVPVEPSLNWLAKFVPSTLVLADDSPVSAWTNGGSGPSLAQSDATRRPLRTTIDGRASVTFDGSNDRLELAWSGSLSPASYVVVYRPTELPTGASIDYLMDTPDFTGDNRHRIWLAEDGVHFGAPTGNGILVAPPPSINQWHVASMVANGALSICRSDGVDYSFNVGGAGSTGATFGGPSSVSITQSLTGALGDIRVMGSALSLTTLESVEQALAYQYGITLP